MDTIEVQKRQQRKQQVKEAKQKYYASHPGKHASESRAYRERQRAKMEAKGIECRPIGRPRKSEDVKDDNEAMMNTEMRDEVVKANERLTEICKDMGKELKLCKRTINKLHSRVVKDDNAESDSANVRAEMVMQFYINSLTLKHRLHRIIDNSIKNMPIILESESNGFGMGILGSIIDNSFGMYSPEFI